MRSLLSKRHILRLKNLTVDQRHSAARGGNTHLFANVVSSVYQLSTYQKEVPGAGLFQSGRRIGCGSVCCSVGILE